MKEALITLYGTEQNIVGGIVAIIEDGQLVEHNTFNNLEDIDKLTTEMINYATNRNVKQIKCVDRPMPAKEFYETCKECGGDIVRVPKK